MSNLDWRPLTFRGDDFVSANPGRLQAAADGYEATANKIQSISEDVTAISRLQGSSEAVDALIEETQEVAIVVSKAQRRYRAAAGALRVYASDLSAAQTKARNAWQSAHAAQAQLEVARQGVSDSWGDVRRLENERDAILFSRDPAAASSLQGINVALSSARTRHSNFSNSVTRHNDTIAEAQLQLNAAIADHEQAGNTASSTIRAAFEDGLTRRNRVLNWFWDEDKTVLANLSRWFCRIATVAGIAGLVLAWVPILGPALKLIAGLAAALKMVTDLVRVAQGEIGWRDAILSVVGGVLAIVGLAGMAKKFNLGTKLGGRLKKFGTSLKRLVTPGGWATKNKVRVGGTKKAWAEVGDRFRNVSAALKKARSATSGYFKNNRGIKTHWQNTKTWVRANPEHKMVKHFTPKEWKIAKAFNGRNNAQTANKISRTFNPNSARQTRLAESLIPQRATRLQMAGHHARVFYNVASWGNYSIKVHDTVVAPAANLVVNDWRPISEVVKGR